MTRISSVFKNLKTKKEKAFIPFIVAGFPDIAATEKTILTLADAGADIIELGIPFSDPVADGPVIQSASHHALVHGITLDKIFAMVERVRKKTDVPIVFMSYYNPILNYGFHEIADRAKKAGVDGFIVPDLPPESAKILKANLKAKNIDLIFLVTINSLLSRTKLIAKSSSGFIYLVSRLGVTGAASFDAKPINKKIMEIKKYTKTPIAVGFGVSNAKQAEEISKHADGIIIGSALVKMMSSKAHGMYDDIYKFAKNMKNVTFSKKS